MYIHIYSVCVLCACVCAHAHALANSCLPQSNSILCHGILGVIPCLASLNHFNSIAKSHLRALLHTAYLELLEGFLGFSSTRRARSGYVFWHHPPWFPSQWLEGIATPKVSSFPQGVTSLRCNLCSRAPCVLRPSGEMGPQSCYLSSCSASLCHWPVLLDIYQWNTHRKASLWNKNEMSLKLPIALDCNPRSVTS